MSQASLFKQELSYYLSSYVTSDDPNILWNNFKTNFLAIAIAQKHEPLRQRRVKHEHKPWLTNEIKQLIFHRDNLKRQSVRVSSTDYHAAYKRCKNRVNKLIESTKKDYITKGGPTLVIVKKVGKLLMSTLKQKTQTYSGKSNYRR